MIYTYIHFIKKSVKINSYLDKYKIYLPTHKKFVLDFMKNFYSMDNIVFSKKIRKLILQESPLVILHRFE